MQAQQVTQVKARRVRDESNKAFSNDGSLASVEKLIYKIAMKCFARAQALGVGMTFDDVHQEMNVSYILARNTWKEDGGALFSTYMTTCCYRNFNELMRRYGIERQRLGMVNMTDMKSVSNGVEGDDDDVMERMDVHAELSVASVYGELTVEGSLKGEVEAPMSADPALLREQLRDLEQSKAIAKIKLRSMTDNTKSVLFDLLKAASERESDNDRLPRFTHLLRARGFTPAECTRIRKEVANAFGVKVL